MLRAAAAAAGASRRSEERQPTQSRHGSEDQAEWDLARFADRRAERRDGWRRERDGSGTGAGRREGGMGGARGRSDEIGEDNGG